LRDVERWQDPHAQCYVQGSDRREHVCAVNVDDR